MKGDDGPQPQDDDGIADSSRRKHNPPPVNDSDRVPMEALPELVSSCGHPVIWEVLEHALATSIAGLEGNPLEEGISLGLARLICVNYWNVIRMIASRRKALMG